MPTNFARFVFARNLRAPRYGGYGGRLRNPPPVISGGGSGYTAGYGAGYL